MAVIWSKNDKGKRYEVRRAGHSVRLYTDGVFHSQFNPENRFAANLWTLLLLPACVLPTDSLRRVLVLGVGGGAVIRLCRELFEPDALVGVDNSAVHLDVARRFFGIDPSKAELVHADARQWIHDYEGPPFGLIVDDLFGEQDGEPVRAVPADGAWLQALASHLAPDGVLTVNFVAQRDLRHAVQSAEATPGLGFENIFRLNLPNYENVIGAFMREAASARGLRAAVAEHSPVLARKVAASGLRVRRMRPSD